MKKDLLPIFFLLLPLINFGQTLQPVKNKVVTKINSTFKDSIKIASPNPKYVIPIHTVKPIKIISIKKELEKYLTRNNIGLNENYLKIKIFKNESDTLKFKGKTSPEFKIGLSEFKPATMSIRNKNYIGISLSENYLKNETKSELDSLKCNNEINHSKIRKKHNIGIGYGFAFVLNYDIDQPHYFLQDNYAVIAYKYLISLKATDFIALKTTHSFNFFNGSPYKKSSYRWTVELGYEYKRKKIKLLNDQSYLYYLIGFGRYVYNTSNPIYFFNADNILNETTTLHLNFASFKVGWQLGENFFIDSFILYNYGENPYSKVAIGLNFYFMPSF